MEALYKSLVEKTTDAIVGYIKKNNLIIGSKLPNEYDLAKELEVSRSTLREAVRILVSRNILEVRQGSGTYVSEKRGVTEDPLGFSLIKDTFKLTKDLFEIRYLLEPKVALLAAENASDEDIQELHELKCEIETAVDQPGSRHFELDIRFHSVIARASDNVAMNHLIPIINQSINLYNDFYTNEQSKNEMLVSHQNIYDAIKEKDSSAAYDAMLLHIAKIKQRLKIRLK